MTALGARASVDRRGLSRAALLALVASGLVACGSDEDMPVPHYGAPAGRLYGGAGGVGGSGEAGAAGSSAAGGGGAAGEGGAAGSK